MKKIQFLVDQIEEEICGAKDYAECYLDFKSRGSSGWAAKYKGMAEDELKHATIIHDRAVEEIANLEKVYTAPVEMKEKWDKAHKKYIEKVAWIKTMLSL